jgi:hypothetical protein
MEMSLREYRKRILDSLLALLWRQWTALGAPGYGAPIACWALDPEALFAFTCALGRYDARLFDMMAAWLHANERLMNIQRLRTLFQEGLFTGLPVAAAVARTLGKGSAGAKWHLLSQQCINAEKPCPLFLSADGTPLPVLSKFDPDFQASGFLRSPAEIRAMATPPPATGAATLVLRLRGLFGVSARCEILLYLLTHPTGYPREIARKTHYFHKTIHDALTDMAGSSYVSSLRLGREREYRVESRMLKDALLGGADSPVWIDWPVLFGAIEQFWGGICLLVDRNEEDPLLQSSELRKRAKKLVRALHGQPGFPVIAEAHSNEVSECLAPLLEVLEILNAAD